LHRCKQSLAVLNHNLSDGSFAAQPSDRSRAVQSTPAPLDAAGIPQHVNPRGERGCLARDTRYWPAALSDEDRRSPLYIMNTSTQL
jgi:hypothetical protein